MEAAVGWHVDHLLGEDAIACSAGLEGGPVAGARDEGAALGDDLVLHDVEAAGKVALRQEDRAVRVVLGEAAVGGIVEGAVVALRVFVLELEETGLAGEVMGFGVDLVDGSVGVVDVAGGVEAGFGAGEGLEGVGPEGALVGLGELSEAWAVAADGAGSLGGKQLGRKRLFDEGVPGGIPGVGAAGRATKFRFLFGDGGGGLVCGWGAGAGCGGEDCVERVQAESARRALSVRARKRGIVAFQGAGPEGSVD